ncbi:MFS transporter [Nakamurella multipartita]|jgi:UMF1 family MFS transporter|uniref:Major facilitator superfamily MFS_1 n=1 Tax=Nakamurella multipartita (strain ATCC 700099 / DSM 44233 / CIP 104796 / JCM 9543 / NBRC 105858 / Y-104) TaxID=479431 RepID=C8X7C0_NAKMY|nr:MFS transporter [Nakamurella multipartita]ACV76989.1 major facilitator superfamily MFS_1 [Nakamurella multipartita DSM 44233]
MSAPAIEPGTAGRPVPTGRVVAWGVWDWGSAAYNAVILTFVFSVYLTDAVGVDLPGGITANTWLGWSLGLAGLFIAVLAPVTGQRADAGGRRRLSLGVWTALTVITMAGLFFVQDDYHYLWLGLLLLSLGSIFFEFASVSYNAMLHQVSTPRTIGRVSAFGWSMGYFGGIVLLLICYVGFIAPDVGWFGVTSQDGLNIRMVAIFAALWFALFGLPVLFAVPEITGAPAAKRVGFFASYGVLFRDLREMFRTSPHTVYFLGASALFRDGLAAVFTFGAVLAVTVYGINSADVLIFGVVANVVSAIGALTAGRFDDRLGPKTVIVFSLSGMLISGTILLFVSGPTMFWIFGLFLCLFVGPAQSSSRTFLARLAPVGKEGQLFGLYATTGRAVSFLAPTLFGFFTFVFDADRAGIVGILLVLGLGLLALLPVRPPATAAAPPA